MKNEFIYLVNQPKSKPTKMWDSTLGRHIDLKWDSWFEWLKTNMGPPGERWSVLHANKVVRFKTFEDDKMFFNYVQQYNA